MTNKYLEKIASKLDPVKEIGSSLIRVTRNTLVGAKNVLGKQVHLADGGGYRDHAYRHLRIKDPNKLADFDGSKDGIKALKRTAAKQLGNKATFGEKRQAMRGVSDALPKLREQQTDGRMATGLAAAGGIYALHKAREKINEPQERTYTY